MRYLFSGRSFDPDTDPVVGTWDNGAPDSDFNRIEEKVYKNSAGDYFIERIGGPETEYKVRISGRRYTWGKCCEYLTEAEFKKWLTDRKGKAVL